MNIMTPHAVISKDGVLHTVIMDGVLVGQDSDLQQCKNLASELNESSSKRKWLKAFCELHDRLEGLEPPAWEA